MKNRTTHETTVYYGATPLISNLTNANDSILSRETIIYNIYLPNYNHLLEDLQQFLDIKEQERATKYYKATDRNRFIISRVLLKCALASYTQSTINDITIELLPNKKPYLPKYPKVFFNISHSSLYAVLAISNKPIGIDIEYINLNTTFQDTFQYIFDSIEIQFINNAVNQTKSFYSLWTRKEAFVKALGKGIDDDFYKIPCLDGHHILDSGLINSTKQWQVHNFLIDDNQYIGAIAMPMNVDTKKLSFYTLPNSIEELMRMSK